MRYVAATSGSMPPGLVPVAASVVEARASYVTEVLVSAVSVEEQDFLVVF